MCRQLLYLRSLFDILKVILYLELDILKMCTLFLLDLFIFESEPNLSKLLIFRHIDFFLLFLEFFVATYFDTQLSYFISQYFLAKQVFIFYEIHDECIQELSAKSNLRK